MAKYDYDDTACSLTTTKIKTGVISAGHSHVTV